MRTPPAGYELLLRVSPVIQPWMPIYAHVASGTFSLGLHLSQSHCNSRGFAHGGIICSLADIAMGYSVQESTNSTRTTKYSTITTNIAMDFLSSGKPGQWLEFRPVVLRRGSVLAVAECHIYADDKLIARSNAGFRLLNTVD